MTQKELLACKNGLSDICYEQAVNQKIRARYTLSQELALLRQREEKPQEFEAYHAYAQACKASVKAEFESAGISLDGNETDTAEPADTV